MSRCGQRPHERTGRSCLLPGAFGSTRDPPREAWGGCTMAVVIMAQPGDAAAARAAPAALCVSKRA
eukprot:1643286-Prymnesium_polylepis.1